MKVICTLLITLVNYHVTVLLLHEMLIDQGVADKETKDPECIV
jgi:hypothetical protein